MPCVRYLVGFMLLVLSPGLAQADGLIRQLPKDGTWANYDLDITGKRPNGSTMNIKGTLSLSSVGQVTEDDLPCRWIEVQFQMKAMMGGITGEKVETYKMLIPEKYLAKGETPIEHVVRAWSQRDNASPAKFSKSNDVTVSPLPTILSAPWNNIKQLDKAEVESKLGKVACDGIQGTLEFKVGQGGVMRCKFENRIHPKSPFGVVTSRWSVQVQEGSETNGMDWSLKLADFGENAKSKMPAAK